MVSDSFSETSCTTDWRRERRDCDFSAVRWLMAFCDEAERFFSPPLNEAVRALEAVLAAEAEPLARSVLMANPACALAEAANMEDPPYCASRATAAWTS